MHLSVLRVLALFFLSSSLAVRITPFSGPLCHLFNIRGDLNKKANRKYRLTREHDPVTGRELKKSKKNNELINNFMRGFTAAHPERYSHNQFHSRGASNQYISSRFSFTSSDLFFFIWVQGDSSAPFNPAAAAVAEISNVQSAAALN